MNNFIDLNFKIGEFQFKNRNVEPTTNSHLINDI